MPAKARVAFFTVLCYHDTSKGRRGAYGIRGKTAATQKRTGTHAGRTGGTAVCFPDGCFQVGIRPGIDSLKAIAKYFSVSLDSLLSCDTVLAIAEEDGRQAQSRTCSLVFGLLDISGVLLLFLPVFGERTEDAVRSVSLLVLQGTSLYMRAAFFALIAVSLLWGILLLTLQNSAFSFWQRWKDRGSLALSAAGTLLFMAGRQPYAGALTLVFLLIKMLLLLKRS